MALFYQQNINVNTRLAIWKIEEDAGFFLERVPLKKEISHPHKRLQHLAGRYLLRYLFPEFPNEEILIADTRKPFLPSEQFHFSISHCRDYAAAIVSTDKRVGIDIEAATETVNKVKNKFLHETELPILEQQTDTLPLLTTLWSAKEAMFKWWGRGEVDFREMMRVDNFLFKQQGSFNACFIKDAGTLEMQMHYRLFEDLSLVWVATENGHYFV
jgi:4'-phosphopantetheinyl transferase EntD